jgi:DNA-directed RNA polymerase subunit delta
MKSMNLSGLVYLCPLIMLKSLLFRKDVRILSLAQYTKEQLEEMSLIDMAYVIIESNNKETVAFTDIMDIIVAATGLKEKEVRARIAQFYTEMNLDGRFLCMGDNKWGLRSWYPVEQAEEDTITQIKPKKKKAKKLKDDDDFDLDYDDTDDEDFDEEYEDELLDEDEESFDDIDDLDEDDDADEFEDEEILDEEEVFDELDDVEELDEEEEEDDLELDEVDDDDL